MSYSKGNWNVRGNKIFIDDSYKSIATVHVIKNYEDITFKPIDDTEAIANANLIAAAPELLEACKWALEQFRKLAANGNYPEFMMAKNGGIGAMPLVKAIKQAEK